LCHSSIDLFKNKTHDATGLLLPSCRHDLLRVPRGILLPLRLRWHLRLRDWHIFRIM